MADNFVVFSTPETAPQFLIRLHPKIKFAQKFENADSVTFLDVKMSRGNDGTVRTSVLTYLLGLVPGGR